MHTNINFFKPGV